MRVLERRWRSGHGELDLIMRSGRQMVFVEVRVRTGEGHPLQLFRSIGRAKWRILRQTAIRYIGECAWRPDSVRFDMIGIQRGGDGNLLRLTHWENVGVFGARFRF
jgi:putative endonuclease